MPKESQLTLEERGEISQLKKSHPEWSGRQIAREIGRSKTCLNSYLKNTEEYRKAKRCGRPKATTRSEEKIIFRKARFEKKSASQIASEMPLECNIRTVQRRLQNHPDLVWREMAKR